ncbi:DUF5050 domain-containing protein [Clostridium butyricum]|uniref:DUF5050 domain-containing protein n=1 Tax=Clostridium butyricum TaxID=1492 RepID=A0A6L9ERQ1_CLOBU|nr:DUF5050 domain-containing protein [Clostridium butyricum]
MKKLIGIALLCCTTFIVCSGCGKTAETESKTTLSKAMEVSKTEEKHDNKRSYGNTINNMYKKKQVAMYDGYMYYADENDVGLYKGKYMDESSKQKLNDDNPMFINIYKNNIYYICKNDNIENQVLVKVDLDGVSNRVVIDKNVENAIIQNDKLMYVVYEYSSKSGYAHTSAKQMDLKTGEITKMNFSNPSMIINGKMSINIFRGADKYIEVENGECIPHGSGATIELLSANDDYIIARINNYRSEFDNSIYAVKPDGTFIKIIDTPIADEIDKRSILVDDTFYYFQGNNFMKYDIKEEKGSKLFEDAWDGELFEFDGIIYVDVDYILSPMYDTSKNEAIGRGKWAENQSKKVKEKRDSGEETSDLWSDITVDEAKELILKEDGNYINQTISDGSAELKYIRELPYNEKENFNKMWNLGIVGQCYQFEIIDKQGDYLIDGYIVDRNKQLVYKLPSNPLAPAYLMKDNKQLKEYEYIQ